MSEDEPIGVGGEKAAEIGSARLALALANQDMLGIGQALRHDYVVAPILRSEQGEPRVLVTTSTDPTEKQFVLPLYSSAHTLNLASGGADRTEFALRQGASLVDVLEANSAMIQWVAFDQAGPHPVWARAADVRSSLEPRVGDDEVAWAANAGSTLELEQMRALEAPHPVGLDLAVPAEWVTIELDTVESAAEGVERAARARYPGWGAGRRRAQARALLLEVARRATSDAARSVVVAAPDDDLIVVVHWHEIGPIFGAISHLDRLSSSWDPADSHVVDVRAGRGAWRGMRTGVDYWLEFPDGRGLCQLEFRGVRARQRAQAIVSNAEWV